MNCVEAKNHIKNKTAKELVSDLVLRAHLDSCDQCREYAEELRLQRLLRTMPAPPLSADFATRALDRAWNLTHTEVRTNRATPVWLGVAASLLLTVTIGYQSYFQKEWQQPTLSNQQIGTAELPAMQIVQAIPNQVMPVNVRLVSKEALPDATITVQLKGGITLAGYQDAQRLSWQAPLSAGNNELSLPIQLGSNGDGSLVIEVRSGDSTKQMIVTVKPSQQTELSDKIQSINL